MYTEIAGRRFDIEQTRSLLEAHRCDPVNSASISLRITLLRADELIGALLKEREALKSVVEAPKPKPLVEKREVHCACNVPRHRCPVHKHET